MTTRREFLKVTAVTTAALMMQGCQRNKNEFLYSSSIDMAITNLYARTYYPIDRGWNLPVLVVMHGFIEQVANIPVVDLQRLANYGFFVLAVGMRGRDGASGSQDGSGREIYDIYDAVEYVRASGNPFVSQTKAALVGYSGGGANALACACKFPDYFNVLVDHFGMSDYGYDDPDGWWYTNADRQATLTTWIGNRASVTNPYYARLATAAVTNFTGGKLYIYHDDQDTSVPIVNTNNVKTALDAAGMTNYSINISTTTDNPRWLHGYPNTNPNTLSQAEPTWTAEILSRDVWSVPASGTVTVIGYIKTKRFAIWLNKNGTTTKGIDAVATVAYNTATDTYTVTPLITGIDVSITQGAKTGAATNITEATEITVS